MKARTREAVKNILNKESEIYILHGAVAELRDIFTSISPVKGTSGEKVVSDEKWLDSGLAISPDFAAITLDDFMRTAKFLRGVKEAVDLALDRFSQRPVHLLYAGCGPFGTIVVPLLHLYDPKLLKVSLIDIHQVSLDSAENICRVLDVSEFIAGSYCCDASQYRHPEDDPVHIVVTETMAQVLRREPQVSITGNLAEQLVKEGILVPEEVSISLQAVDSNKEYLRMRGNLPEEEKDSVRKRLGDIFVLDKNCRIPGANEGSPPFLPAGSVTLADDPPRTNRLMLFTEIRVFGENIVAPYESGLTSPLSLKGQENLGKGETLVFKYQLGSDPCFVYGTSQSCLFPAY
ncbi:MAG: hypothetical protein GY754_12080 [bacterium]|nr:hypothetical protein [bacterium]